MLFNSIDFAIFLPIVFIIYWFVVQKNLKIQNLFLLLASYLFYGWWDWRFLFLLLFSTMVDYTVGVLLLRTDDKLKRKLLLGVSIVLNLGLLGFFKYYNFFVDNFVAAFSFFGREISVSSLRIILPVGISFYTFQTLSYGIDVYRRKLEPTKDFIAFATFVTFFPQLVAGPIERATNLLPQFFKKRVFNYSDSIDGLKQILWGLFKKMVIADNCAELANTIFNNSSQFSGSSLALGALFFAFQIYCDFSGYSDIAVGTSKLFGFSLMRNFAYPYFSRNIGEFWRRWHISLSTWFRDYLYIPLGGSRGGKWMSIRNTFIIFIVSGFWHGANWTFVAWGALNACYFLPLLLMKKNRVHLDIVAQGKILPSVKEFFQMLLTFSLTVLAWIFFRATDLHHAFQILSEIFSSSFFTVPEIFKESKTFTVIILLIFFLITEWFGREHQYPIEKWALKWKAPFRYALYYAIIFAIIWFGGKDQQFIYFQF